MEYPDETAKHVPLPAHTTFEPQWDVQSPRRLFGNPHRKPHAWERQPVQRASETAPKKAHTIWKRCDARPEKPQQQQFDDHDDEQESTDTIQSMLNATRQLPEGKIVKRRRLSVHGTSDTSRNVLGVARRDRRWSVLPHKIPNQILFRSDEYPNEYNVTVQLDEEMPDQNLEQCVDEDAGALRNMNDPVLGPILSASHGVESDMVWCYESLGTSSSFWKMPEITSTGVPQDQLNQISDTQVQSSYIDGIQTHEKESALSDNAFTKQAAAQHLEIMRRELALKTPRRSRRRTDFIGSKSSNSQISKKRRVSAAVDNFRSGNSNSLIASNRTRRGSRLSLTLATSEQIDTKPDTDAGCYEMAEDSPLPTSPQSTEDATIGLAATQTSDSSRVNDGIANEHADSPLQQFESLKAPTADDQREGPTCQEVSEDFNVEESAEEAPITAVDATRELSTKVPEIVVGSDTLVDIDGDFSAERDDEDSEKEQKRSSLMAPSDTADDEQSIVAAFTRTDTSYQSFGLDSQDEEMLIEDLSSETMLDPCGGSLKTDVATNVPQAVEMARKDVRGSEETCDAMEPTGNIIQAQNFPKMNDEEQIVDTSGEEDTKVNAPSYPFSGETETRKVSLNDDDTNILKDFLTRARASKAAKIANQSALLNRRDSDVVKHALGSPRNALDDIDANSPSPKKLRDILIAKDDDHPTTEEPPESSHAIVESFDGSKEGNIGDAEDATHSSLSVRRSSRVTNSANSSAKRPYDSACLPNEISLRRQEGSSSIVLKRTEAQELSMLTRTNTRRNKGGAVPVRATLMKLKGLPIDELVENESPSMSEGRVRWNEDLVAIFDESNSSRLQSAAEGGISTPAALRPRARRARTLGAMNGTPAKPRPKDLEQVMAEEDTMELDAISAMTPEPSSTKETRQGSRKAAISSDEMQIAAAQTKQQGPKTASRSAKRIPTPAKPKRQTEKPATTRTGLQALDTGDDNKENESKSLASAKVVTQTRGMGTSGGAPGTTAEAHQRSLVPLRRPRR